MTKKIISCSRRTDIPAFYYDWLQNTLKNKTINVQNVLFPEKTYTYDLSPEEVKCIVLWSKNFKNVVNNPGILEDYNLIFNYTITGYSKFLEPNVPEYKDSIKTIESLLNRYKPEQIRPRFDPIILSVQGENNPTPNKIGMARLIQFEKTCKDLSSLGINNITYSFVDLYPHVTKRLKQHNFNYLNMDNNLKIMFSKRMVEIACKYNIQLYSCSEQLLEDVDGIQKSHCIDGYLIDSLFPCEKKVSKAKDRGQRKACGCCKSLDIGGYLPCNHNCIYCYQKTKF